MGSYFVVVLYNAPCPPKGVNNDEIRLSILCQCYMSKFKEEESIHPKNLELGDIDEITRSVNLEYLVDKRLLNGYKASYSGRTIIPAVNITAWGMDVVEDIMKQSLGKLDPGVRSEIEKEGSDGKMIGKLYERCVRSVPVCEAVVKVAHAALAALGHV